MPIFYPCQQFARCSSAKVDTKQLANLRRGTGYGLSTCREALLENDNDIEAAQAWLDAQAVKKGWQKAAKLEDRKVGEGLVGVLVENNHAAMVEIRCETDFVAQNDFFKDLVSKATATALGHRKMIVQRGVDFGGSTTHFREVLLTHKLNGMKVANSEETINDVVLQIVGRLGERLMLKRAVTMTTNEDCVIGAYTHGPFTFDVNGCRMGKYAALVALQPRSDVDAETLRSLATRLSQHIVGMNPSCMSVQDAGEGKNIDKADILLEQNYLMDESMTVGQFLERNGVSVVDFLRMECGDQ